MKHGRVACLWAALALTGCGSHPEIPVSDQQTLVMESDVPAAGISAEKPELTRSDIQATATASIKNVRHTPVTLHYRFYWYDARGLEMHPLDVPRSITVPAGASVTLYGRASSLGVYKTRLYLYL